MEIFVEFRDDEDGENFLAELKKRPTDKFEASDYDHLIKPLPRHKKGYFFLRKIFPRVGWSSCLSSPSSIFLL
jgi:hypothetical protein